MLNMIKISLPIFFFFISLFVYTLIYLSIYLFIYLLFIYLNVYLFIHLFTYLFIYLFIYLFWEGSAGIFFIFVSGGAPDPHTTAKLTLFINIGEDSPVCREHVHTGRPHTRIDNSIFKQSDLMSFQ